MFEADHKDFAFKTQPLSWLSQVLENFDKGLGSVLATVIVVKGSTPRNIGAQMIITKDDIWQTIGGGAFEFNVMARARKMLKRGLSCRWRRELMKVILGPDAGQCCGGSLSVLLERFGAEEIAAITALKTDEDAHVVLAHPLVSGPPLLPASLSELPPSQVFFAQVEKPGQPLFIYGAGHVTRSLLPLLRGQGFDVFIVDIDTSRFPMELAGNSTKLLAKNPEIVAFRAPVEAAHLVMTHDHSLDEAICQQILTRGEFAFLGLIGSKTKRARFVRRLTQSGISSKMLDRLTCPVGISEIIGKEPPQVALSIATQLAVWLQSGKHFDVRYTNS